MFGLPNPTVIGGIALAFALSIGWAIWERHDAIASAKAEQAALARLELAAADVQRWQEAATERQGVIDRQAQTLKRLESDGAAARAIADAQQDQAAAKIAALEANVQNLKEAAHARPEDVRDLGPIVRDALLSGALGGLQH